MDFFQDSEFVSLRGVRGYLGPSFCYASLAIRLEPKRFSLLKSSASFSSEFLHWLKLLVGCFSVIKFWRRVSVDLSCSDKVTGILCSVKLRDIILPRLQTVSKQASRSHTPSSLRCFLLVVLQRAPCRKSTHLR